MDNKKVYNYDAIENGANVSPKDLLVYFILKKYSEKHDFVIKIPVAKISAITRLTSPTIISSIKNLERNNLLKIKKEGKTNTYCLNKDNIIEDYNPYIKKNRLNAIDKMYIYELEKLSGVENTNDIDDTINVANILRVHENIMIDLYNKINDIKRIIKAKENIIVD